MYLISFNYTSVYRKWYEADLSGHIPADVEDSIELLTKKIVMKLIECVFFKKNNYFSWEAQLSAVLCSFHLSYYGLCQKEGWSDQSYPTTNQQDQLILSWILIRILMTILSQVVSYRTRLKALGLFEKFVCLWRLDATTAH